MTSAARNRSIAPFSKPDSIDVSQGAKASTSNSADASRDRRRGNRAKAISQPGDHQLARWRSVAVRFGGVRLERKLSGDKLLSTPMVHEGQHRTCSQP